MACSQADELAASREQAGGVNHSPNWKALAFGDALTY